MKEKKQGTRHRRIQKTKNSLMEALMRLIVEKGYEKVTIQDIIDSANVGRSTFYMHYENKAQLLLDGHNNLKVEMFEIESDGELSFRNLFVHIAQNSQLAKAMLGKKSGNMMTEFFKNNLAYNLRKRFGHQFSQGEKAQKTLTYLSEAAGAAVVSLLISWMEDEMPFTIEEVCSTSEALVCSIFEK